MIYAEFASERSSPRNDKRQREKELMMGLTYSSSLYSGRGTREGFSYHRLCASRQGSWRRKESHDESRGLSRPWCTKMKAYL